MERLSHTKGSIGEFTLFSCLWTRSYFTPECFPPILTIILTLRGMYSLILETRINSLLKLEEDKENAKSKFQNHQLLVKRWFEQHYAMSKDLEFGYIILKWDMLNYTNGWNTKFQTS